MNSLEYAQDLVAFESPSYLSNVEVIDYCQERLKHLGFVTERIDYEDDLGVRKSNVIGKKGEGSGGMAYFGHTDVVPADSWFSDEHGPFQPTVKDNRLWGRGSCDMKGSVACMLAAAERIDASQLEKPIYITCTADEEVGYGGADQVARRSELFREMVDGDASGIIGEPTLLEVVYAHKGTYGFRATSHGKASHSSTRQGLNANLAMIPFLMEMKRIHDECEENEDWHNTEFDPPTVSWNIGINDHTKAVNITPPQSVCTVYFRPMPDQDPEQLLSRASNAAQECGIEFEVLRSGRPLYTPPDSPFVREVLQLTGNRTPHTVAYGTDGAMLTDLKRMVVYGPGSIDQAHTNNEWIDLEQLELGADMYEKLIRHWCM